MVYILHQNLTNVGNLMGCSRQNVKKLALALEKKGFVRLLSSSNNSVLIELTEEAKRYEKDIGERRMTAVWHSWFYRIIGLMLRLLIL